MPKRQNNQHIISAEMQGDDSWIEIDSPTMGEMKDYRKNIHRLQERIEQLKAEGEKEASPRIQAINDEIGEAGKVLIAKYVKAWNWVGNDDMPLPQPHEPGAVDLITLREVRYIMKQFQFDDAEKKG